MRFISDAQELSEHRWNHRLLLILTDDSNQELYQKQIKSLSADQDGLNERKLIVYSITPGQYRKGINSSDWLLSNVLYKQYKKEEGNFEVILIGLDGGTKLRQSELLKNDKLYAIIDAMPMRRAEMRREKK